MDSRLVPTSLVTKNQKKKKKPKAHYLSAIAQKGFYSDGSTRNIHCCSGCPNTTDSPNCHGQGIYWFPTEIAGYGTTAWPFTGLQVLLLQWSCLSDADLHACDGVSCKNLGVCMGGMLGQCLCQPGWGGSDCSTKLDVTPCFGVNCGLVYLLFLDPFS